MELLEIGVEDDAGVAMLTALVVACDAVDAPWSTPHTQRRQRMQMLHSWDGEPGRYFLAMHGGTPVGSLVAHTSEYDNLDLVWFQLAIAPEHRRHGLGTALHRNSLALARELGRPSVLFDGWDAEATRAFAATTDFPLASVAVVRVQDLTWSAEELDHVRLLRAEAEAASVGYDLVRVAGRTPDDLAAAVVEVTAAINDAPTDDLVVEDEVYSVARMRAYENAQLESGQRFRRVIAFERATSAVAGHTVATVDAEQPAYGEQHDTTVLAAHRGHRLGLRLKTEMLCWLAEEEPQLRRLETQNAESNAPMIAVNESLGYRVAARQLVFQRRLS